ncbi:PilZ domain-containing protein [Paenibacillus mendelii]|uniref:PilZ domain-containing protein n=1 Tax=Paenibacillus mendelii TaxID=206163 RepID=A0ABV6JK51_9BACL|nr:PilZ domain-containing protein [Paenibacillus mendelii]MCQ6558848.1 PilZ domain-containing protein [Paenibacillus mendelii]
MNDKQKQISRKHVRIRLRDGVQAKVSIFRVFDRNVDSKDTPILLNNMSPSGLQFAANLRFPVSRDYSIRVLIAFGEWEFSIIGHVVWRRQEENLYVYGCSFLPDHRLQAAIVQALNEKLKKMSPNYDRIHAMYRELSDTHTQVGLKLDAMS